MVFLLKALAGVVALGGVVAPVALLQSEDSPSEKRESQHFFSDSEGEATLENQQLKVQKVLKWIKEKKCQMFASSLNENRWSNAVYACERQANGRANFYYVGPENSFITEKETNLIRKISSVNYLPNKEKETALLLLSLEDGEVINWDVIFESGWREFKDVNLSGQCRVVTSLLGGDDLVCVLKDPEEPDSLFSYIYPIFVN